MNPKKLDMRAEDLNMKLISLTDHLSMIVGRNQGRFPWGHVFLVRDSVTALIDSGCGIGTLQALKEQQPVDLLINSHCHPDHSAGNWVFVDQPLYVPREGAKTHGRLELLSHRLAEPGPLAAQWRRFVTNTMDFKEKLPTDVFKDGDNFEFGHFRLQALHAPGHTFDHYFFFEPDRKILLSFDFDMTPFGPFYGHRESDLRQLKRSIRLVRDLAPRVVVSSHSEVITEDIDERVSRFEAVLERRAQRIRGLLRGGATLEEVLQATPIYGHYPYEPELLRYWEGQMIRKHLEEMMDKGSVRQEGDRYLNA